MVHASFFWGVFMTCAILDALHLPSGANSSLSRPILHSTISTSAVWTALCDGIDTPSPPVT
jgi:hypothetical protein